MSAKGTIINKAFGAAWKHAPTAIIPTVGAISEFQTARDEGKGVIKSAIRAGTDFAVGEALGWWYVPLSMASAVPSMAVTGYNALSQINRQANSINQNTPFINNRFNDTQGAYTMRQQGMQLAKASKFNLEQTLMGNEASYFKM